MNYKMKKLKLTGCPNRTLNFAVESYKDAIGVDTDVMMTLTVDSR